MSTRSCARSLRQSRRPSCALWTAYRTAGQRSRRRIQPPAGAAPGRTYSTRPCPCRTGRGQSSSPPEPRSRCSMRCHSRSHTGYLPHHPANRRRSYRRSSRPHRSNPCHAYRQQMAKAGLAVVVRVVHGALESSPRRHLQSRQRG